MAHGDEPNAYDYLATSKVGDLTVAQLEQTLENSFLNKTNLEFWKGPITMHRLLEVSRTYPWGLPIPESGTVGNTQILANESADIQPTGTELWQVQAMEVTGIGGSATLDISLTDGTTDVLIISNKSAPTAGSMVDLNEKVSSPFVLSNSLYLKAEETGASFAAFVHLAYYKVSL